MTRLASIECRHLSRLQYRWFSILKQDKDGDLRADKKTFCGLRLTRNGSLGCVSSKPDVLLTVTVTERTMLMIESAGYFES